MTNLRDKIADALADSDRGNSHGRTHIEYYDPQVDAVLAAMDDVRAEAWDAGHESAAMRVPEGVWHDVAAPHPGNPYRKAEQ